MDTDGSRETREIQRFRQVIRGYRERSGDTERESQVDQGKSNVTAERERESLVNGLERREQDS